MKELLAELKLHPLNRYGKIHLSQWKIKKKCFDEYIYIYIECAIQFIKIQSMVQEFKIQGDSLLLYILQTKLFAMGDPKNHCEKEKLKQKKGGAQCQ